MELQRDLVVYIDNAIKREFLTVIKARISNHRQRGERMCNAARGAGATRVGYYLLQYGSNHQFMRYFVVYLTPNGERHTKTVDVTI